MNKSVRVDFYIVLGIILVSVPIILFFNVRPLISAIYFFIIPTIYLFLRKKKPIKELLVGSLLIGNGLGLMFNIIASANNAWVEVSSQLVFNYRLFGFLPIDEPIWFFFWAFFILTFYEHFYEKDNRDKLSKKFKFIAIPTFLATVLTVLVAVFDKERLVFNYAYFFSVSPVIIPIVYVLKYRPGMIMKFIKTGAFFFMLCLIYELTAVSLGQWYFPGQYIGWVELMGIRFPFEELLFWMGVGPFAVLSLYEGFVDDDR